MTSYIARAYARRIDRGEITLDDIPESIREKVAEEIAAMEGGER